MGMRGMLYRDPSFEPCSPVLPYPMSWSHATGLECPAEGNLVVGVTSKLSVGKLLGLMRPQLHEGAIMAKNSSLSQRLILSLTSDAGDFDSASAEWACSALGSNPHTSWCFQTSVLTLLAYTPSLLGILGPQ